MIQSWSSSKKTIVIIQLQSV